MDEAVNTNQWYDVALVRAGGVSTLYVNGTPYALSMGTPNVATSALMIGGNPLYAERFNGRIDEARIFTFSSGSFNPSTDLLIDATTPEPASFAFVGLGIAALWFARRFGS